MKALIIASTAALALTAPPATAGESSGGVLTALRVGTTFKICRDKVKTAYGVGPGKVLTSDTFETEANTDVKGDRVVRYAGFTQETGRARVAIAGVCHVRRDGPSTIELGKPQ